MKRMLMVGLGAAALVAGIANAPAQTIDEAVQIIGSVAGDPGKLKQFCALNKLVESSGDKDDPATEKQIDDAVDALGDEFAAAWEVGVKAGESTPEGKKFSDAVDALADKCE